MGGCCSKSNKESTADIDLGTVRNEAVTCKCGPHGKDIKVTIQPGKHSTKVDGTGIAIGSCALDCDIAYFEVIVGKNNPHCTRIGLKKVAGKKLPDLNGPLDAQPGNPESPAWVFDYADLKEGDVVGIHWDQTDLPMLSFTLNGIEYTQAAINRIRPAQEIFPAISMIAGSCEFVFEEEGFQHKPKSSKFKMIVCATSLI